MRTKEKVMEESFNSNNFLGIFHWNFPLQCGFMNKKLYKKYKTSSSIIRDKYKDELSEIIINDSNVNTLKLPINPPTGFNVLFKYINPDGIIPDSSVRYRYIQDFFNGLNNLVDNYDYEEVLEKIVDSIDIYSLGFTLQYILNCFNKKNMLSPSFFNKASLFFYKMYNFNPSAIELNIDILLDEYEHILLESGILKRLKKSFKDHNLINNFNKRFSKNRNINLNNEKKIIFFLRKRFKNIKVITCHNLSLKKQIEVFANAKTIIGVHGADFANIIFGLKNIKRIIEFCPPVFFTGVYPRISKLYKIDHVQITGTQSGYNHEFSIELNDIKKII
jgi:hypothetical protein